MRTSVDQARLWLVRWTLVAMSILIGFLIVAPQLGYPMEPSTAMRLGELVFPVFFGYLGSATAFLIAPGKDFVIPYKSRRLFALLLKAPVMMVVGGIGLALVMFGITNGADAAPGTGMSVETLSATVSLLLGLLTITTNALVVRLFRTADEKAKA